MKQFKSNVTFKSNLYPVTDIPYNDLDFIQNVYDPKKLIQIKKCTIIYCFPIEKEFIIKKSAICSEYKKYVDNDHKNSQYQVFCISNNKLKDTCKCKILQCPYLLTVCRPNQKEQIENEIKLFSQCIKTKPIDTRKYYPIMINFKRVIETYGSYAYKIISNTDMEKYKIRKKVSFAYSGDGNGASWDNWVGGIDENYFQGEQNKLVPEIPIEPNQVIGKNPMLELQKINLKNLDNPFFKRFKKL